jgi:hypothetical protein
MRKRLIVIAILVSALLAGGGYLWSWMHARDYS